MKFEWDFTELLDFGDRIADTAIFEEACEKITKQIAKELHKMLINNTPVKTGTLQSFWQTGENYSYTIKRVRGGFQVTLVNEAEYALSVNDGHYSHNQFNKGGEPYVVRNRTVPHTQGEDGDTFVFGRFFVEASIAQLEESEAALKKL
jgi:hypothetical protein